MATQREVAAHLDLSTRWVRELTATGVLPRQGRAYDLDACRTAYLCYLGPKAAERGSLDAERARLAAAQADRTEMEVEDRRASSIPTDDVARMWRRVVADAFRRLGAVPEAAAARVVGASREEARAVLEDGIHAALRELAGAAGTAAEGRGGPNP